ncbi:MAG: hypothetical protein ACETVZ_04500, partial [Phycisphaerae bacterium]
RQSRPGLLPKDATTSRRRKLPTDKINTGYSMLDAGYWYCVNDGLTAVIPHPFGCAQGKL